MPEMRKPMQGRSGAYRARNWLPTKGSEGSKSLDEAFPEIGVTAAKQSERDRPTRSIWC